MVVSDILAYPTPQICSKTVKLPLREITHFKNLVPEIVIGNNTVTPNPNPVGLSIFNGTFTGHPVTASGTSGGVGVAVYTGSNFTTAPEAFQGAAAPLGKADAWLAVWVTGFVGLGALVYYL